MHLHKVRNKPLKAVEGVIVVVAIALVLCLTSVLAFLLRGPMGDSFAILVFWIIGGAVALFTMRRYILSYSYAMSGSLLRMTFAYGRFERVLSEIYLNNVLSAGTPEEVRRRYPKAKVLRAIRPTCEIEVFAVASRDNGGVIIHLLQPDETIREALTKAARENRK